MLQHTRFSPIRLLATALACVGFIVMPQTLRAADAPQPAARPGQHPLVGTWTWSLFDGKCTETFDYRANGSILGTSGDAVTQWTYVVSPSPGPLGFYTLVLTSVRQNGKKDCSGDKVEEPGSESQLFIQFSPASDRLIACKTAALSACFGPLTRLP